MSTNKEVFDEIAESWYAFRHWSRFTDELEEMSRRWSKGVLLNVGCAHGPDFLPFANRFDLCGIDISERMIKLARRYAGKFDFKVDLVVGDAQSLPFLDETFDWVIAIATYHHIHGDEKRLQSFRELRRILKPSGEAFITVWNRWQPKFWLRGEEITVPWRSRQRTVYRYYHLFSYYELRNLLTRAGFEVITMFPERSHRFPVKYVSRNICSLIKK